MDDRSAVLATAESWSAAIVSNEAEAIARFMHDDWQIVAATGATSKASFLATIRSGDLTHDMMRIEGEARIAVYGDIATLTARMVNSGLYQGTAFSAEEWTTDVFVRDGDRWLCVLSHVTSVV